MTAFLAYFLCTLALAASVALLARSERRVPVVVLSGECIRVTEFVVECRRLVGWDGAALMDRETES